jgi:hypothetical protein
VRITKFGFAATLWPTAAGPPCGGSHLSSDLDFVFLTRPAVSVGERRIVLVRHKFDPKMDNRRDFVGNVIMLKSRVVTTIVFWATLVQTTTICHTGMAAEAKDLRTGIAAVAQVIKDILDQDKLDSIAIGPFIGPTSAGPGIAQILSEELAKKQVGVKDKAALTIRGEFEFVKDKQSLQITAKIVDRFGGTVQDLNFPEIVEGRDVKRAAVEKGKIEIQTKDEGSLLAVAGVNVGIPTDARPEERNGMIFDSLKDPASQVVGGTKLVALTAGGARGPYGIEILVDGKPRPITQSKDEPEPNVRIARGETYELRVVNDSDYDAAVDLRIDGVSDFAFSEFRQTEGPKKGQPLYDHWIVAARQTLEIKGWHKNNQSVDSFLVTEFAKGAAAQLLSAANKDTSKFGTVSAVFSAAWPADSSAPPDEPPLKKGVPNLTGVGPPKEQQSKEVRRFVGIPRASVSVRYSKPTN